jgi:hypothetical protein
MSKISLGIRLALYYVCFLAATGLAQNSTAKGAETMPTAGPVPPAVLTAKTVFVANAGADGGLFPHPFSGDPNRGYDQFYAALQGLGQYELVSDPSQADVVLELRLTAPYGPTNANKVNGAADPLPTFRLEIYDRRSHYLLWALTESIEIAVKQKTHDRNFDEALTNLLADFQALTRRPATAGH